MSNDSSPVVRSAYFTLVSPSRNAVQRFALTLVDPAALATALPTVIHLGAGGHSWRDDYIPAVQPGDGNVVEVALDTQLETPPAVRSPWASFLRRLLPRALRSSYRPHAADALGQLRVIRLFATLLGVAAVLLPLGLGLLAFAWAQLSLVWAALPALAVPSLRWVVSPSPPPLPTQYATLHLGSSVHAVADHVVQYVDATTELMARVNELELWEFEQQRQSFGPAAEAVAELTQNISLTVQEMRLARSRWVYDVRWVVFHLAVMFRMHDRQCTYIVPGARLGPDNADALAALHGSLAGRYLAGARAVDDHLCSEHGPPEPDRPGLAALVRAMAAPHRSLNASVAAATHALAEHMARAVRQQQGGVADVDNGALVPTNQRRIQEHLDLVQQIGAASERARGHLRAARDEAWDLCDRVWVPRLHATRAAGGQSASSNAVSHMTRYIMSWTSPPTPTTNDDNDDDDDDDELCVTSSSRRRPPPPPERVRLWLGMPHDRASTLQLKRAARHLDAAVLACWALDDEARFYTVEEKRQAAAALPDLDPLWEDFDLELDVCGEGDDDGDDDGGPLDDTVFGEAGEGEAGAGGTTASTVSVNL